jgi:Vitamin K epoxide reductase family.
MSPSSSIYTRVLSTVGIILSCYALYVEYKTSHPTRNEDGIEEEFQALCDIESIGASCSQVFALPEGKMMSYFGVVPKDSVIDVPNAALGLIYYSFIFLSEQFLLTRSGRRTDLILYVTFALNCAAMSSSIFLATKLFQLGELCVLCWTTHLLNSLLLIYYFRRLLLKNKKMTKKTVKDD